MVTVFAVIIQEDVGSVSVRRGCSWGDPGGDPWVGPWPSCDGEGRAREEWSRATSFFQL